MKGEHKERWKQLCEQVAEEQNSARFSELIAELLEELEQKDVLLKHLPAGESKQRPASTGTND